VLGQGSLHAALINGGEEAPSYPERCHVVVERRSVPGETPEHFSAELAAAVARARERSADPRWTATVSLDLVRNPLATPKDAAVVQALRRAYEQVVGSARLGGAAFWSDAALMSAAGIPTAVFGVIGGGMHGTEEWAELESLRNVVEVLQLAVAELCGKK